MRIIQLLESQYTLIDEKEVPFRVIKHGDKYTGFLNKATYRSNTNDIRIQYTIDELMVDGEEYQPQSDREYEILKNFIVANLQSS